MSHRCKSKYSICSLSIKKVSLFSCTPKRSLYWLSLCIPLKLNLILNYYTRKRASFSIRYCESTSLAIWLGTTTILAGLLIGVLFYIKSTQVSILLVWLWLNLKGGCMCVGPQFWHLLQGRANCPLPVSTITDCYWGGVPTYMFA